MQLCLTMLACFPRRAQASAPHQRTAAGLSEGSQPLLDLELLGRQAGLEDGAASHDSTLDFGVQTPYCEVVVSVLNQGEAPLCVCVWCGHGRCRSIFLFSFHKGTS